VSQKFEDDHSKATN